MSDEKLLGTEISLISLPRKEVTDSPRLGDGMLHPASEHLPAPVLPLSVASQPPLVEDTFDRLGSPDEARIALLHSRNGSTSRLARRTLGRVNSDVARGVVWVVELEGLGAESGEARLVGPGAGFRDLRRAQRVSEARKRTEKIDARPFRW